jgi:Zn-dependent protease
MFLLACLPCGCILGIPIRIHWSAPAGLLILGAMSWSQSSGRPFRSAALHLLADLVILAAIPAMVLAHELAHAIAGRICGVQTHGIYLHLFGGLALVVDPLWLNLPPQRKMAIFAAGPASNFLCCASALALAWALDARALSGLLMALALMNLGMGLFNLLPIWPLDGGQLLHAFLLLIRARSRVSDWVTLAVTLLLGIPFAFRAWTLDECWIFSILLVLMSSATWLLTARDDEPATSAQPTLSPPEELLELQAPPQPLLLDSRRTASIDAPQRVIVMNSGLQNPGPPKSASLRKLRGEPRVIECWKPPTMEESAHHECRR